MATGRIQPGSTPAFQPKGIRVEEKKSGMGSVSNVSNQIENSQPH